MMDAGKPGRLPFDDRDPSDVNKELGLYGLIATYYELLNDQGLVFEESPTSR